VDTNGESEIRIVFVYLGDKIPKYATQNYFLVKKTFPKNEVWFVVDDSMVYSSLKSTGVRAWLSPRHSQNDPDVRNSYRNGFWVNTTNRFFALFDFHQAFPDQSLLHIESDVILFPGFPVDKFDLISKKLAFPMSSSQIGLASSLWSKNIESTKILINFTRRELSNNPKLTDTEILGRLAHSHSADVLVLRSGPSNPSVYRDFGGQELSALDGGKSAINDFGIFDASTLGIHLCGSDPRNSFGRSHIFDPLPHHFLDASQLDVYVENRRIFVRAGGEVREVYSLHNHSKNPTYFEGDFELKLMTLLKKRSLGIKTKYSVAGFFYCLEDYFNIALRRLRKTLKGQYK
jgi:hypothetical protein